MKPKHILATAALALGLSNSACNPTKQNTQERVDLIMKWSEQTPENERLLKESNDFYSNQPDFEALTPRQQAGKVILRKILSQAAEALKKGEGLQEFCQQILHSDGSLINNPEVRLKVTSDTGVDIEKIDFGEGKWVIFTPGGLLNRVLEDPKVTSVALIGDTLTVTVEGKESSLVTLNKHSAFAEEEGKKELLGDTSYTFDVSPEIVDPQTIAAK